jgi:hypothetical protein
VDEQTGGGGTGGGDKNKSHTAKKIEDAFLGVTWEAEGMMEAMFTRKERRILCLDQLVRPSGPH